MDCINLCRCTVEQQRKRGTKNPTENQGPTEKKHATENHCHRLVRRPPKVAARPTGSPGPPHGEIPMATWWR